MTVNELLARLTEHQLNGYGNFNVSVYNKDLDTNYNVLGTSVEAAVDSRFKNSFSRNTVAIHTRNL